MGQNCLHVNHGLYFYCFNCVLMPSNAECSFLALHLACETVGINRDISNKLTSGQLLISIWI